MPRLTDTPDVQIDSVHSHAICDEVGYRLRQSLKASSAEHPRHRRLLDRLGRIESGPRSSDAITVRRRIFSWTPLHRRRG
jgi:hypothetical protein